MEEEVVERVFNGFLNILFVLIVIFGNFLVLVVICIKIFFLYCVVNVFIFCFVMFDFGVGLVVN